jgi:hypothetical protein
MGTRYERAGYRLLSIHGHERALCRQPLLPVEKDAVELHARGLIDAAPAKVSGLQHLRHAKHAKRAEQPGVVILESKVQSPGASWHSTSGGQHPQRSRSDPDGSAASSTSSTEPESEGSAKRAACKKK